jgi:hypothetical protein
MDVLQCERESGQEGSGQWSVISWKQSRLSYKLKKESQNFDSLFYLY